MRLGKALAVRLGKAVLVFLLTSLAIAGDDAYAILGVARSASGAEIKAAYRRQALAHHPDKGGDPDVFVRVSQAYEDIGSADARRRYDATGGAAPARRGNWGGAARAREMFTESFGDELWRHWEPGATVTGSLSRDGERVDITIHPDGTVDERTTKRRRGQSSTYSRVTRTSADGVTSSSMSISLEGGLGRAFANAVVPDWLAGVPGAGAFVVGLASWVPSLACLGCCFRCFPLFPSAKRHAR